MKPEEIDKLYRAVYDKQSFAFEERHWAAFKNQREGRSYFGSWPFLFVYVFSGVFAAFMLFTTSNIPSSSKLSNAAKMSKNASEISSFQSAEKSNLESSDQSKSSSPANTSFFPAAHETTKGGKTILEINPSFNIPPNNELRVSYEQDKIYKEYRQTYYAMSALPAYHGNLIVPFNGDQHLLSNQIALGSSKNEGHIEKNQALIETYQQTRSRQSAEEILDYDENFYNGVANKSAPVAMNDILSESPKDNMEATGEKHYKKSETSENIKSTDKPEREAVVGLSQMRIKTPSINMPDWKFRVSKGKNQWGGLPRLARPLNFKVFVGHYWGSSYDIPPTLSEVDNQPSMQNVEVLVELIVRNRISFQGGLGFSNIYEKQTFDWIETSGNQQLIVEELKISALNIPVNVNYNVSVWRLHWKMGTGFTVGLVMNSNGRLVDPREIPPPFEPTNRYYNTFFMDWNFYNEIGVLITDHWAVTLKPEIKVNINSMYNSSFWLSRKNFYYGVGFGIIYSW